MKKRTIRGFPLIVGWGDAVLKIGENIYKKGVWY